MTLIVEDGSGLSNAESYRSVADFDAHCAAWGYDLTGMTVSEKEIALRKATAFIDTLGRYKATRLVSGQALEFPRAGLTDDGGLDVVGVPARVGRACMELAFKARSAPLQVDLDRGGKVLSEAVGPLSRTYAADAPAGKTFTLAQGLLAPYLRADADLMGAPLWIDPDRTPLFDVGMQDFGG